MSNNINYNLEKEIEILKNTIRLKEDEIKKHDLLIYK